MNTREVSFKNGAVAYFDDDVLRHARLAPHIPCASDKAGTGKVEHSLVIQGGMGQTQARKILALLDAGATYKEIFEQTGFGGVGVEIEAFGLGLKDVPEEYAVEALRCLGEGRSWGPVVELDAMIRDYEDLCNKMSKAYGGGLILSGTPIVGNPTEMHVNLSGPYGAYISKTMSWLIGNFIDPLRQPAVGQMHARILFDYLARQFDFRNLEELMDRAPGAVFPFAAGHVSQGIPPHSPDFTVDSMLAIAMSDVANCVLTRGPLEMMAAEMPIIWGQMLPFRDARMALRGISRSTGDGFEIGTYDDYKKRILMGLERGLGNSIGRLAYPSREGYPGLHAGTRLRVESPSPRPEFPTARVEHTGRSSAGPLATLAGNAYLRIVMLEIALPAVASGQHPSKFWGGTFPTILDHSSQAILDYIFRAKGNLVERVLRDALGVLQLAESNALKRRCPETLRLVELCRAGLRRVCIPEAAPDFKTVAKTPEIYNIPDTLRLIGNRGADIEEIVGGVGLVQAGEMRFIRSHFGS